MTFIYVAHLRYFHSFPQDLRKFGVTRWKFCELSKSQFQWQEGKSILKSKECH